MCGFSDGVVGLNVMSMLFGGSGLLYIWLEINCVWFREKLLCFKKLSNSDWDSSYKLKSFDVSSRINQTKSINKD